MIKLLGRQIAVDPRLDSEKSSGGLYIPEIAQERADQGIVKYVGPDVIDVKIGDYVLFSGYTGTTVKLEDEGLLIIMHEDFVTCLIFPPDTEVPGLYFRDKQGEYFPATYEMATTIIMHAFSSPEFDAKFKIHNRKNNRPKPNEYDNSKR
jgi:chaperonin GroES